MKVEDLQSYITLFRDWLNERAAPLLHGENPSLVLAWRDELATAERLLDEKPELPIALLGPSQQGKSSLINAIVGENILPVAVPQSAPEHLSASGLAQAGHPGSWRRLFRHRGTHGRCPSPSVSRSGVAREAGSRSSVCLLIHGRRSQPVCPFSPPLCSLIIARIHTVSNCLSYGSARNYGPLK